MKRRAFSLFSGTIALGFVVPSLVSDPIAFVAAGSQSADIAAHAKTAPGKPLSANDVSWLFPAPKSLDETISIGDLSTAPSKPVWSDEAFAEFYNFVSSDQLAESDERLQLPIEARSRNGWYISAVRFDPSAPGLSNDIARQYGRSPQIRLSLHPIVKPLQANTDGTLKVHDFAVHLIFGFTMGKNPRFQRGCLWRPIPDNAAFMAIIRDLADLRSRLASLGADTAGTQLGVHPGLINPNPDTAADARRQMKRLLARHLSAQRLDAMAVTGLVGDPRDKPKWIFLFMMKFLPGEISKNGGWTRLRGPALDGTHYAEVFDPTNRDNNQVIVPIPHTNNLKPPTCRNYAHPNILPPAHPRGHSAAELFPPPTRETAEKIFDTIADPKKSHGFNTDCVSCHTETSLAINRFTLVDTRIKDEYRPNIFNLRNFGWAPVIDETDSSRDRVQATLTRRTVEDTEATLKEINDRLLR